MHGWMDGWLAVMGTVKVVLLDSGNRFFNSNVYGRVNATTKLASGEELPYTLLSKQANQSHTTRHHESVPLQRNLISAQLGAELHISADLWDYNKLVFSDDQIVVGSVVFVPRHAGTTDKADINGPCGKVRVEVTWSTSYSYKSMKDEEPKSSPPFIHDDL